MPAAKEVEVKIVEFVSPLARVIAGVEQVYGKPEMLLPEDSVTSVVDGTAIIALPTSEFLFWLTSWVCNGEADRRARLNQEIRAKYNED